MPKPLSHSSIFDIEATKSKYINIGDKEIVDMIKTFGYNQTIDKIVKEISKDSYSDFFPYKKYFIPENMIKENFKKLSNYKFKIVEANYKVYSITFLDKFLFDGKSIILEKSKNDYLDYNIISDYFQEECRIKCKRYDTDLSPDDYWRDNKNKIVKLAIKKYGKINVYSLRESLYELSSECTSFRPTIMVSLIQMFRAKRILDFSSGWGDRLIGCLAMDNIIEYYCGIDPNTCLHPNYSKMIEFFGKNKKKYNMIESQFEKANVPKKNYDLVCTSPPYFSLEEYSDEDTQSISENTDIDSWLNNFLYFSIKKAWKLLMKGGHMVIIINDMKTIKFVESMINFVKNKIKDSEFRGVIGYGEKTGDNNYKSPQPMWVWRKAT